MVSMQHSSFFIRHSCNDKVQAELGRLHARLLRTTKHSCVHAASKTISARTRSDDDADSTDSNHMSSEEEPEYLPAKFVPGSQVATI